MKKVFLLLGLIAAVFTSCLKEDTEGCPATRNLLFTHYCSYNSETSFDNTIANDVLVYTYKDGKLVSKITVPYGDIKGGKPYSYTKEFDGNLQIVAWAVSKNSSAALLPQCDYNEDFYTMHIRMESLTRTKQCKPFDPYLYLGRVTVENDNIEEESTHKLPMTAVTSHVQVNVFDPGGVIKDTSKEMYAVLKGIKSEMDLDYNGLGDDAEVYVGLKADGSAAYTTGLFGALPSADKTIDVNIAYDHDVIARIKTGEKTFAGGLIEINVTLGIGVTITVNGWEIVADDVKWM